MWRVVQRRCDQMVSKSEIRRPKSEPNPKPEIRSVAVSGQFIRSSGSVFGFISDFEFRTSDFKVTHKDNTARCSHGRPRVSRRSRCQTVASARRIAAYVL